MKLSDSIFVLHAENSNVLFSIPHDGLSIEQLGLTFAPRKQGVQVHDQRTAELIGTINEGSPIASVVRGLLPREVCDYNRPATEAFEDSGVETYYATYHKALEEMLEEIVKKYGFAVLLDIHSFWGIKKPECDIILGSRGGATTPDNLDEKALAFFSKDFATVINEPGGGYSGGYTVETHSKEKISALQIEISSTLLLDRPAEYEKLVKKLREFLIDLEK